MIIGSSNKENRMAMAATTDVALLMEQYDSRPEGHFNEEITTSRIKYGRNEISNHNRFATLKRLHHSFVNVFIVALAVIDILWMILDPDIVYFVILTTLILVSGTMTFVQETRSSKAAAKLVSMVTTIITVRREDAEMEVDSKDIVVGDIIILDTGDMIPADVRIVKSNNLRIDQSSLTGESGGISKTAEARNVGKNVLGCNNLAFMGTNVTSGSGEAIVIAVGNETVFGSMTEKLSMKNIITTYDKGSKEIVHVLLKVMLFMVPPVFLIMITKGYLNSGAFLFEDVLEATIFSLTLAIGLMPEMLATIVSTNLAKGAIDMSKKKVIVKDVSSIQNFGAMDILCSDKTGTLTQNRISVTECNDLFGNANETVRLYACLNARNLTSATNQIDWAIEEYAHDKYSDEELDGYQYVGDVPFDFTRRRATTIVTNGDGIDIMVTKGAIPEILSISSSYLDEEGDVRPLDDRTVNQLLGLVESYGTKGMRVLGISYKEFSHEKTDFSSDDEYGLIISGMLVFTDPVKDSSKEAVTNLKEYGVDVKVLTGDNEYVSRYVCEEIGIPTETMITGDQIDSMSDSELKEAVEGSSIFARLTPDNKARIVLALRENGHTVGLMGDGINDVVAMKNSDVSISVDTGTDIAKETANMILLEKDLNILKDGVIEGRKVYVNSIKYVKMIGSINFGYMFSLILGSLIFNFEPMGAVMILIFNLINDFACLAIPWDKVEDEFVREPRKWDAPNLKAVMFRYGPMCPLTDIMTWLFMIFIVFPSITVATPNGEMSGMMAVLTMQDMSGTAFEIFFASIWIIEQYWMQVWAIHIVRTNKLPFFETCSSKLLVCTTIIALVIGTLLPFTGPLWAAIAHFPVAELIPIPWWTLLWMPFIAIVYFAGAHLVKLYMLKTKGFFAC